MDRISRFELIYSYLIFPFWDFDIYKNLSNINHLNNPQNINGISKNISFDRKEHMIIYHNVNIPLVIKLYNILSYPGFKRLYLSINKYIKVKNLKKTIENLTKCCVEC